MEYAVIIASSARPKILEQTLDSLATQSAAPNSVILTTVREDDWVSSKTWPFPVIHISGAQGIPKQLNAAIALIAKSMPYVFIFDDDVELASNYCENALRWFERMPGLIAFSGHVLRDGGVLRDEARGMLFERVATIPSKFDAATDIYGCNMCIRCSVLHAEAFDEQLPGYAWLFELEWARRVKPHGEIGYVSDCLLVHLAEKAGRAPGYALGKMQVQHPIYLYRKGRISLRELIFKYLARLIVANIAKMPIDSDTVDRLGRLRGNMDALRKEIFFKR